MSSTDTSLKIKILKSDLSGESEEEYQISQKDKLSKEKKNENIQRKTYDFRLHSFKRNYNADKKQKKIAQNNINQATTGLFEFITALNKNYSGDCCKNSIHNENICCPSENKKLFWPSILETIQSKLITETVKSPIKRKKDMKVLKNEFEPVLTKKIKTNPESQSCFIENKEFVKECSIKKTKVIGMEDENTQPSTKSSNSKSNNSPHIEQNKANPKPIAAKDTQSQNNNYSVPRVVPDVSLAFNNNNAHNIIQNPIANASNCAFNLTCLPYQMQYYPNYQIKNFVEFPQNFVKINTAPLPQNIILNGGLFMNNMPKFLNTGIRANNPYIVSVNNMPNFIINPYPTISFIN